jgi:hypothetical protein
MEQLLAQNEKPLGRIEGLGKIGFEGNPLVTESGATGLFTQIISTSIGLMTMIAGIWFLFVFLGGAYGIISSGGEKGAYEAARKKIMTGLMGLIVVISAIFLAELAGWIFGLDFILNPGEMITRIKIK